MRWQILLLVGIVSCGGSQTHSDTTGGIGSSGGRLGISDRSVAGFYVSGPDTDVKAQWWTNYRSEHTQKATFDEFARQYQSLKANDKAGSGATDAALKSFKLWCARQGLLDDFKTYWKDSDDE